MGCSVPVVTYCVFKILLWCLNLLPALRGVKQAYIFNDCGGGGSGPPHFQSVSLNNGPRYTW